VSHFLDYLWRLASQSWVFVSLEVRVITAEKEAHQTLCIPKKECIHDLLK
jgi:hypothetical protein